MPTEQEKIREKAIARGKRLLQLRVLMLDNMQLQDFAALIGVHANSLSKWEKGRGVGLTELGAEKVAKALAAKGGIACDVDWLLYGDLVGEAPKKIQPSTSTTDPDIKPTLTVVREPAQTYAVTPATKRSQNDDAKLTQERALFLADIDNGVVLQATDDSMLPLCGSGDYVGGQYVQGDNMQRCSGKCCIVKTTDGTMLIRKIYHNEHGNYDLYRINPAAEMRVPPFVLNKKLLFAAPISRVWRSV